MTEIIAAVVGIISTIIVSIFTYFMAKRAGIGPYQDTLVAKLNNLVDVQKDEIEFLKRDKDALIVRVSGLEKRVEELEDLTVRQALIIDRLNAPRTTRKRITTIPSSKISSQEGNN